MEREPDEARAKLRLGARGSPLSMIQARGVARALADADPDLAEPDAIAIVPIQTTGDRIQDRPLAEIGGKGLFTKEIERALADGRIDVAVHSLKDVATSRPEGLELAAMLARDDPRDALIARGGRSLPDLPQGAKIGTSSLRRRALIKAIRPDVVCVDFRGNVGTRLRKLDEGQADATLLARASLDRLELTDVPHAAFSPDAMLPAVAQGVIAIERRRDDRLAAEALAALNCADSAARATAERAALAGLDGDCRTPIAAFAEIEGETMRLRVLVARPDGSQILRAERRGSVRDAEALGRDAAAELRPSIDPGFFWTAERPQ